MFYPSIYFFFLGLLLIKIMDLLLITNVLTLLLSFHVNIQINFTI